MVEKNNWIQVLRGIAALMVVFFHLGDYWALVPELQFTKMLTRWGFAGVDIFFVLSGYVVYQSADKSQFGARHFLIRRAMRIYLGYWPVLLTLVLLGLFGLTYPSEHKNVSSILLLEPFMWNNWLPTAWSLTYELYFYLWVAIICAFKWVSRSITLPIFFLAVLLWNSLFLLVYPAEVYSGSQALRFPITGLGLEFLAGAAIAHFDKRYLWVNRLPVATLALGLVLTVAGFTLGTSSAQFDTIDILRSASYGVAAVGALLLVLGLSRCPPTAPKFMASIGDASYSLYLIHPVLLWMMAAFQFRHIAPGGNTQLIFFLLMPVVIVVASLVWFRWVEQPLFQAVANDNLGQRLLHRCKNYFAS
ncbi:MAG: acyltransferase [Rhodoferax sp.]|jgi:exopolysaccharide production protein ExoZ|uniref:acyltransferase family protein n=1 Tax=Rhodoferax sp. TaxID=50421 RepID=UPI001B3E0BFC|nr:acyltransferase [Rhodoferax sp.]MBP9150020.1 acyltransferase [Rhodoferax sp.]MBP9734810.1 acyltransferase [Rhodoferax sp.]